MKRVPPQTDAEWARDVARRIRRLESPTTVRVGEWVFSSSPDGRLIVTKPGDAALDVGSPPTEPVQVDVTRGGVTEEEVTEAITGEPGPLEEVTEFLEDKWTDLDEAFKNAADSVAAFFQMISDFDAQDIPGLIAELLKTQSDAILALDWVQDLIEILSGVEDGDLDDVGTWVLGVLNKLSPLNALNLFNLVPTNLMAHVPISNLGTYITNLVTDPTFLDGVNFNGGSVYSWDNTTGHAGMGSARTTADGTGAKDLLSNLIAVSKDQVLPLHGWVKWDGLTGSGTPIQLNVTGYHADGATEQVTIAQRAASPPTTDWTQLAGNYTVPADVVGIRLCLTVAPTASAGTVWWDDLSATKAGPLLQRLVAGTGAGKLLHDDINGLFNGIMSNASDLLNKAGLDEFNELLSIIGGQFGEDMAAAEQRLDDFLHSLSPLNGDHVTMGEIADQFVPGLSTIHDALVTAVGNLPGNGFDIGKVLEVLKSQTDALVAASGGVHDVLGRMSNLESQFAALPVSAGGSGQGNADGGLIGAVDSDGFERVSSTSLGPQWLTWYKGGAGVWATPNGHDATFAESGIQTREFICVRNNVDIPHSQTDYQRITMELSGKAQRYYDAILGTFNFCGFNDLWLRISDDSTGFANVTGIRIRYGGDGGVYVHRFVNGVGTQLEPHKGTNGITPPGPGSALIGEAGSLVDGVPRVFNVKLGTSIVLSCVEQGVASMLGPGFRRWGHGGLAEGHTLPLPGQQSPGGAHFWGGVDQTR